MSAGSPSFPLAAKPGDRLSVASAGFDPPVHSSIVWNVEKNAGGGRYLLTLSEEPGESTHLFFFEVLPEGFCFAGAWETVFGGNGVQTQVADTWLSADGQQLLLLLRSTGLARGYRYDPKPGEPCPTNDGDDGDDATRDDGCHVPSTYETYFSVLLLDMRKHRLTRAYAPDQADFGRRVVSGLHERFVDDPAFAARNERLVLSVDGADYLWSEAQRRFVPVGPNVRAIH